MIPTDVPDVLHWIDEQQRTARAECERLLAEHNARPPGSTAEDVKASMRIAADVAAAIARLETWNELRGELGAQMLATFETADHG